MNMYEDVVKYYYDYDQFCNDMMTCCSLRKGSTRYEAAGEKRILISLLHICYYHHPVYDNIIVISYVRTLDGL